MMVQKRVRLPRRALRTILDVAVLGGLVLLILSTLLYGRQRDRRAQASPGNSAEGSSVEKVKQLFRSTRLPRRKSQTRDGQQLMHPTLICPTCDPARSGDFAASSYFSSVPLTSRDEARQALGNPEAHSKVKRYLVHHIPLAAAISKAWMSDKSQNMTLNSYLSAPDNLVSYNFRGLQLDRPTTYIYTRTGGRKLDVEKRLEYFAMLHETVRKFTQKTQRDGYSDGTSHRERQLVHIVVRDESQLDPAVQQLFEKSSIREAASSFSRARLNCNDSISVLCSWSYS